MEIVGGTYVVPRDVMAPIHLDRGVNCDLCQQIVHDVWTCASCMTQGHRQCLNLHFVAGFAFCSLCAPQAQAAYQRHTEEQRSVATVYERFSGQLASSDYDDQRDGRKHWISRRRLHRGLDCRCGRYGARGGQQSSNDTERISTRPFRTACSGRR